METAHALAAGGALDPQHLIQTVGMLGLLGIIFAECGLMVGFFLPGDSLLFAAGVLVKTGRFDYPLWVVCLLTAVAAIAGNLTGYAIGRAAGPKVFSKPESRLFRYEHVEKAQAFFDRFGPIAIVLARFVPVVRTFITVMAGAARMDVRRFAAYTVVGGVLWTTAMVSLGYWLGNVKIIADHIELIVLAAVAASLLPIAFELLRRNRRRTPAAS